MLKEPETENKEIKLSSPKKISVKISQRSELAEEVLSRKPDFMETWSLYIFLFILLLAIYGTWFIKYPDIIEARATLTSKNGPKEIIPKLDGRLIKLFVHNNEHINKGSLVGWIESTAEHQEVIELSRQIDNSIAFLNQDHPQEVSKIFNRKFSNLGEMQLSYQLFITAWQQYNDYLVNGFYAKKKSLFEIDSRSLDSAKQMIKNQRTLIEQDINLAEETFNMNKILAEKKIISKEEFRLEKSKYLNKQLSIPQLDASLLVNETQKHDKLKEIHQLNHDIDQQKIIFQQTLQSLKSQIDEWKKKYLLISPVDGKVVFTSPIQENQYLQAGKLLGYIDPQNSYVYAEVNLSQNNFGKIDTGLSVQLRFDAYPYQENGSVKGTLNYISSVPSDSGFLATVKLDNGLTTDNNSPIPYKNGLKANAIIITKNMRLLERLYYNLIKSTSIGNK